MATIGTFDGFHLGHRAVAQVAVAEARRRKLPSVLVTMEPHPLTIVDPGRAPRLLTTVVERARLARAAGLDAVYALRFDHGLARMAPSAFIADFLVDVLDVRCVVVGDDFRFGQGNAGDVTQLREAADVGSFDVRSVPLVRVAGERCSSTLVRRKIDDGELVEAHMLLGHKELRITPSAARRAD